MTPDTAHPELVRDEFLDEQSEVCGDSGSPAVPSPRQYRCPNPDEGYDDPGPEPGGRDGEQPPYMITVWLPGDEPTARVPEPLVWFHGRQTDGVPRN